MISDKVYSDEEIKAFYDSDLEEKIELERSNYDTPPNYDWVDKFLQTENFDQRMVSFPDENGEVICFDSPQMAKEYFKEYYQKVKETRELQFAARLPFDPSETIKRFRKRYQMLLRHGAQRLPVWVRESVDKRLIALYRIPESAYKRLAKEEKENERAFQKIVSEASQVLDNQDIPEEIESQFRFHDAELLMIKKVRSNIELYLSKCGGVRTSDTTPYIKIIFNNVQKIYREKGLVLRTKIEEDGELYSNCRYLYDELYKNEDGYEVHMLLWTPKALRYLTIQCENIAFEDNISIEV